jgi:hypothetical protein
MIIINKISSYDDIIINQNTLVVFDIDDTILKFKEIDSNWWDHTFNNYMKYEYDKSKAIDLTIYKWAKTINLAIPRMIDSDKFNNMINRIKLSNSHLILLTARKSYMKDMTIRHLAKCNIKIANDEVYHSEKKGQKLYKLIKNTYNKYQNIIFVDDLHSNIDNVYSHLLQLDHKLNINLYHFISL